MFEAALVCHIEVDVVVNVDTMWCRGGVALGVKDAFVQRVAKGPCERMPLLSIDGTAPFDLVKDGAVLCDERGVKEQSLGEGGLSAAYRFPVSWAEVRAECEADLEEQIVRQYVREGACHIGMMLNLAEAGFDVIGVNDDVVVGV